MGKILMMPDLELMHCSKDYIGDWVEYACFDAEILFFLRETLSLRLGQIKTKEEQMGDNLNLYIKYWRPFGELLTDMERIGFKMDSEHLRHSELTAVKECQMHENAFLQWVYATQEDAADFNPSSIEQMKQILFAPYEKKSQKMERERQEEVKKQRKAQDFEEADEIERELDQ